MPYYMYVALQEDDKIAVLTIDPETGTLTPQGEVAVPGGPFTLAISPDRKFLYAGCRDTPQLSSFAINPATGGLTQHGAVSLEASLGPHPSSVPPCSDTLSLATEQDCSVTGYRLATATGTLSAFQTLTPPPEGDTERNTCSQSPASASGRFLYAPNRGHNSIA